MIDPEIQHYLSGINQNLTEIKAKKSPGIWRSFFNGMFSAFGYLVGVVLVIIIVGWFLQKTGLIKPFQEQWAKFQNFMAQAENTMSNTQPAQQGNGSVYTLPDGSKVKVVPAN
jgi:hypothetical protein